MADFPLTLFSPDEVYAGRDGAIRKWDDFPVRLLAQGDSWFSIGAMPPWATSNILQQMRLGVAASAVNCAYPGRHLARMVDWKADSGFRKLLTGRLACQWHGILLSGGGNDLIAAAAVLPRYADGSPIPPAARLLLDPDEWAPPAHGAARYLSAAGWTTFASHLAPQFEEIVALRDSGINAGVPLFCHTYAYPRPRNAPASELFQMGPWLYPAMVAYGIPAADWLAVATELIDRLAALLKSIVARLNQPAARNVHLVETHQALTPAAPDTTGPSNDWENEIHPASGGYRRLAALWRPVAEAGLRLQA